MAASQPHEQQLLAARADANTQHIIADVGRFGRHNIVRMQEALQRVSLAALP